MSPATFTRLKSLVQTQQRPPGIVQEFRRPPKSKSRAGQVGGQVGGRLGPPAPGNYDGLADMVLSFALTSILVFGALMFGWITVR